MPNQNKKQTITGVKAFNRDMTCRGFQFEEGKTYTHDGLVKACESGFHFCENPIDTFRYYEPGQSVFREVSGSGDIDRRDDDSKVAVSEITIGAEISLRNLIEMGVKFFFSRKYTEEKSNHCTGFRSAASVTGFSSAASVTGDSSAASVTGDRSAASVTGFSSAASVTGDRSAASVTGFSSAASVTGDRSAASVTGFSSAASVTGFRSAASVTGDRSAASVTGFSSAASVTGDSSAAVCTGLKGKVMAGKFGCIALAWWNNSEERHEMRCAETGIGDGSDGKLKAETWYSLSDAGEFVEIEP